MANHYAGDEDDDDDESRYWWELISGYVNEIFPFNWLLAGAHPVEGWKTSEELWRVKEGRVLVWWDRRGGEWAGFLLRRIDGWHIFCTNCW